MYHHVPPLLASPTELLKAEGIVFARIAGTVILVAVTSQALAQDEDRYAQARLACLGDVMRLCPDALLDADQARACMKDKKKLVSPACAEFYPGGKRANDVH